MIVLTTRSTPAGQVPNHATATWTSTPKAVDSLQQLSQQILNAQMRQLRIGHQLDPTQPLINVRHTAQLIRQRHDHCSVRHAHSLSRQTTSVGRIQIS